MVGAVKTRTVSPPGIGNSELKYATIRLPLAIPSLPGRRRRASEGVRAEHCACSAYGAGRLRRLPVVGLSTFGGDGCAGAWKRVDVEVGESGVVGPGSELVGSGAEAGFGFDEHVEAHQQAEGVV